MAKNRICYAVLVAACIAFSMLYTSRISAVILIIVLLYPIAATILTLVQSALVNASFSQSYATAEKNSQFEFYIDVVNKSFLPCVPLELVCVVPDMESGRLVKKRFYISLPPFGTAKLAVEGKHLYRGCYTATIDRISAVDPLRLIRISKKGASEMSMVFLPRKFSLDEIELTAAGEREFSRQSIITTDKDDFSHAREYHQGENIQFMHWKLSAKQDELMLKQFDSVNDKCVFMLCDWSGENGDTYLRTDTVIETAIAFADASVEGGVNLAAMLGKANDYETINVKDRTEFNRFFDILSVLPVVADANSSEFSELIEKTDMSVAAAIVLITANLTNDVLTRAEELSENSTVYLAYVNLMSKPVDKQLYEHRFLFVDIRGTGEEALKLAVAMAKAAE